jgi:regulator of RNase E activity RraB
MTTSELDKFTQAKVMAFKLGFVVREADNPNDLKRYTLVRQAVETHFATIDDVIAELKRVKP